MRDRRRVLFVVVALGMLCSLASASLAATSGPFGPTSAISYTVTDWTSSLLFPKFNSALGILNEVDISITAGMQTTLTITNNASSSSHGNAKTHVVVTVNDPGNLLSAMADFYSPAYNYTLSGGGSVTSGLLTKSDTESSSWTDAAILAEFNGPGSIAMGAGTFTETVLANTGGNTDASQVTKASATGTVTYQYSLVPEPSSLISALFGLVPLALLKLRKR